jgi:class 3 adenylate cyclase
MGLFRLEPDERFGEPRGDRQIYAVTDGALDRFNASVLGLGDLARPAQTIEAICAVFDLAGFTDFCRQIDPHLAVPEFTGAFLDWLFAEIRSASIEDKVAGGATLWAPLPFFAKFMGDGVMFLWDSAHAGSPSGITNIPACLSTICARYASEFLPTIRRRVVQPPLALRCGVARGQIYSIGDGNDFVGPCINVAARLQKINRGLTFCFSRRGFDANKYTAPTRALYVLKAVPVRGIGERELVYVLAKEFDALSVEESAEFEEP